MNHNGTGVEKINNDIPHKIVEEYGYLYYYIKQEEEYAYTLIRVSSNGDNRLELRNNIIKPNWPIYTVSNGRIYYLDLNSIYLLNPDTLQIRLMHTVNDGFVTSIIATNSYVYYVKDYIGIDGMYRITKTDSTHIKVMDGEFFGIIYDSGYMYILNDFNAALEYGDDVQYSFRIQVDN